MAVVFAKAVWDYTFKKLGIENPADHKASGIWCRTQPRFSTFDALPGAVFRLTSQVLQTEAALNPPRNREKMVRLGAGRRVPHRVQTRGAGRM